MEWWRPALDGRPGSLAQPAGFKRIFARATAFFYTLVLGPWVLWQKTFPNRQVKVILRQRLLGVAFLACFIAYLLAPGLVRAEVVDHSSMPGYSVSSVRAAESHQTVNWRVNAACSQRGVFQLGPWELLLGDPFGVFRVIQSYSERNEILVYPPLADLPRSILPHQRMVGDNRPLRQPLPAETIQAISARPFAPGDPLRQIHWR